MKMAKRKHCLLGVLTKKAGVPLYVADHMDEYLKPAKKKAKKAKHLRAS